jgi:ribosomal protein L11 methyltransferase
MSRTWKLSLPCPARTAPLYEQTLEPYFTALCCFEVTPDSGDWIVEGYTDTPPDRTAIALALELRAASLHEGLPDSTLEILDETDWVAENQRNFPPIRIGRVFIHGSHFTGIPPAASLPLQIDAATAFGTGDHPTTQGCLLALQQLARHLTPDRVFDLGCGTGVLAMAAARLWPASRLIASDIDAESIRVARLNARDNHLPHIRALVATGCRHQIIAAQAPYPLILANILANPLRDMAGDVGRLLAPRGWFVASGLLTRQQHSVTNAYRARGLVLRHTIIRRGWATLVLQKLPSSGGEY